MSNVKITYCMYFLQRLKIQNTKLWSCGTTGKMNKNKQCIQKCQQKRDIKVKWKWNRRKILNCLYDQAEFPAPSSCLHWQTQIWGTHPSAQPWHCLKHHVPLNDHQCAEGSGWISHYEMTSGGTVLSQILQTATKGSLFLKTKPTKQKCSSQIKTTERDFTKISLKGYKSFLWSAEENKPKTTTQEPNPQTT